MLVFVRLLFLSLILNVKCFTCSKTLKPNYEAICCKFACALATCCTAETMCQSISLSF